MRCQDCGHENKPDHAFCARCLESLSKSKARILSKDKNVMLPPQSEHLVDIKYASKGSKENGSNGGWWLALIAFVFIAASALLFYG